MIGCASRALARACMRPVQVPGTRAVPPDELHWRWGAAQGAGGCASAGGGGGGQAAASVHLCSSVHPRTRACLLACRPPPTARCAAGARDDHATAGAGGAVSRGAQAWAVRAQLRLCAEGLALKPRALLPPPPAAPRVAADAPAKAAAGWGAGGAAVPLPWAVVLQGQDAAAQGSRQGLAQARCH